ATFTPTIIPEATAKHTTNAAQKPVDSEPTATHISILDCSTGLPKYSESNDNTIPNIIKYCARIAAFAETSASTATATVVIIPTNFIFSIGKAPTTLSAKPMVYKATERA